MNRRENTTKTLTSNGKFLAIQQKDWLVWFGEWLLSSVVLKAWHEGKGPPKYVRFDGMRGNRVYFSVKFK